MADSQMVFSSQKLLFYKGNSGKRTSYHSVSDRFINLYFMGVKKPLYIILFALFFTASCSAQQTAIDEYVKSLINDNKTAAAAIAVAKNGRWVLTKSYGCAD